MNATRTWQRLLDSQMPIMRAARWPRSGVSARSSRLTNSKTIWLFVCSDPTVLTPLFGLALPIEPATLTCVFAAPKGVSNGYSGCAKTAVRVGDLRDKTGNHLVFRLVIHLVLKTKTLLLLLLLLLIRKGVLVARLARFTPIEPG